MMDVVVIDLSPTYGMLLSRKWVAGLGGYLMMDLSYLCVPNSDGALIRNPAMRNIWRLLKKGLKTHMGKSC